MKTYRQCGIYCIESSTSGKRYVGSSLDIIRRFNEHKQRLNRDVHVNKHLQSAWNLYGESDFFFSVLEFCENADLLDREQWWIDHLDTYHNGYNVLPIAGRPYDSSRGVTWGKKISEGKMGHSVSSDTRERLRLANLGKKRCESYYTRHCKSYVFRSPSGALHTITNLAKFEREINCPVDNLRRVVTGRRKQWKGWTFEGYKNESI